MRVQGLGARGKALGVVRVVCCVAAILPAWSVRAETIVVGSKKFTESYVLGEIAKKLPRRNDTAIL